MVENSQRRFLPISNFSQCIFFRTIDVSSAVENETFSFCLVTILSWHQKQFTTFEITGNSRNCSIIHWSRTASCKKDKTVFSPWPNSFDFAFSLRFLAAKIYYFGVQGGVRKFEDFLEKETNFQSKVVRQIDASETQKKTDFVRTDFLCGFFFLDVKREILCLKRRTEFSRFFNF